MAGINRRVNSWRLGTLLVCFVLGRRPHPPPAGCWKFDVEVLSFVQTFRERDTGYWIPCCFHKLDCNGSCSRNCKGTRSSECAAATQLGLCIIQHTLWKKTSWFWWIWYLPYSAKPWPSTKKKGNHLKLNSPGYIQTLGSVLCPFHLWCGTPQTPRWSSSCVWKENTWFSYTFECWNQKAGLIRSVRSKKCAIKKRFQIIKDLVTT